MKNLVRVLLVALLPMTGVCQEKPFVSERGSSPQNAPNGHRLRVDARELVTADLNSRNAAVLIEIEKFKDRQQPVPLKDLQRVRILDTQGRPIAFRDKNQGEIGLTMAMSNSSMFVATYELVDPAEIHSLGKVTFTYLDKEFDFDVRARPPAVKQ